MILNHEDILDCHERGVISISPFDPSRIGTNSYDVVLDPEVVMYTGSLLDPYIDNPTTRFTLPADGFILEPGVFILGCTYEVVGNNSTELVPMIEGRSSIARLGLSVHESAGFGDIGFSGKWTLEIRASISIVIRPYMPIAQLYWLTTNPSSKRYRGKYVNQNLPGQSQLYKEVMPK